ncbi:hypothetical protein JCM8115_003689 [Rhodotorula mucilaginosa]|uniref:Thioredoxin-like protein n=1 Tax=Rhodotorula mucilaginosa TaxID=5537 RepID=A0A9P6W3U9_RHOMI|nr:hypothetical protein C6P46_003818 [Rhodotorula mucilaginosa]TKA51909.1 hypothetical protein B0A53_04939 [Rhodotorula sp. CCFEE 5036]
MSTQASTAASTSSSSSAANRHINSNASRQGRDASDDDDDALLEELEAELDEDFDLGGFREKRMMELQAQFERTRKMQEGDYGRYTEVKIEKDLISRTAKEKRCVVHFFHRDFRRCKIMDGHLEKLAPKHLDTLFLRADVANVPFLVTKLAIKTLPCVIGFVEGTTKMKIVGFDELPGGDNFATSTLEQGMEECGVLVPNGAGSLQGSASRREEPEVAQRSRIRQGRGAAADDDDLDLDD